MVVVPEGLPLGRLLVLVEGEDEGDVVVDGVVLGFEATRDVDDEPAGDGDNGVVGVDDDGGVGEHEAVNHEAPRLGEPAEDHLLGTLAAAVGPVPGDLVSDVGRHGLEVVVALEAGSEGGHDVSGVGLPLRYGDGHGRVGRGRRVHAELGQDPAEDVDEAGVLLVPVALPFGDLLRPAHESPVVEVEDERALVGDGIVLGFEATRNVDDERAGDEDYGPVGVNNDDAVEGEETVDHESPRLGHDSHDLGERAFALGPIRPVPGELLGEQAGGSLRVVVLGESGREGLHHLVGMCHSFCVGNGHGWIV